MVFHPVYDQIYSSFKTKTEETEHRDVETEREREREKRREKEQQREMCCNWVSICWFKMKKGRLWGNERRLHLIIGFIK